MACNLRSRTLRQELLDEDRDESVVENFVDVNVDDDSHNSDREYSASECIFQSDSEMELELEEASLDQRLLESRARGRPVTKLKGKNGFSWDTRAPSRRTSSMFTNT